MQTQNSALPHDRAIQQNPYAVPLLALQANAPRCTEQISGSEIALEGIETPVTCLAGDDKGVQILVTGSRDEAAAQRVCGHIGGIQNSLDDPLHGAADGVWIESALRPAHGREQGTWCATSLEQPALHRPDRIRLHPRSFGYAEEAAGAQLIVLLPRHPHNQTLPHEGDIREVERDEITASQCRPEAQGDDGMIADVQQGRALRGDGANLPEQIHGNRLFGERSFAAIAPGASEKGLYGRACRRLMVLLSVVVVDPRGALVGCDDSPALAHDVRQVQQYGLLRGWQRGPLVYSAPVFKFVPREPVSTQSARRVSQSPKPGALTEKNVEWIGHAIYNSHSNTWREIAEYLGRITEMVRTGGLGLLVLGRRTRILPCSGMSQYGRPPPVFGLLLRLKV